MIRDIAGVHQQAGDMTTWSSKMHQQQRIAEQAHAIARINRVINRLDAERREPDQWEAANLMDAVGSLVAGCYGLATTHADLASTPHDERSPAVCLPDDPLYQLRDLAVLRSALATATALPALPLPHFGPVELN